jgi:hypothetical protein
MIEVGSDFYLNFLSEYKFKDFYYYDKSIFFPNIRCILRRLVNKNNNSKYLLPNYLCDSIMNNFLNTNYSFFKLDNNLNIDYAYLRELININKYDFIYIINYFGKHDKNIDEIIKLCNEKKITIIEDFTHNLFSKNLYGNICICSFRKILSVPFGAIMINNSNIKTDNNTSLSNYINYFWFYFIKTFAMTLKKSYYLKFIWRPLLIYTNKNTDLLDIHNDLLSNFFFKHTYNPNIVNIRKNNYRYLHENLTNYTYINNNDLYFFYILKFNDKKTRDFIKKKLINRNIYCCIHWQNQYSKIHETILSIPIDQRYNIDDMKRIVETIQN